MSERQRRRGQISSRPLPNFSASRSRTCRPNASPPNLPMRDDLNNRFGIMHGGAIMALADNLGGTATTANLKDGQSTTTIESKTNFFAAVPIGDVAKAECTPLHRGRTTMVWQTRITRGDGKLCALVTQTQLVLDREDSVQTLLGLAPPRLASTTPPAQTTMPAIESASSRSPNRT